jgi:hypothetical protein
MHAPHLPGDHHYIRPPHLVVATSSSVGGVEWEVDPSLQPWVNALALIGKEDFTLLHGGRFFHWVHEKVRRPLPRKELCPSKVAWVLQAFGEESVFDAKVCAARSHRNVWHSSLVLSCSVSRRALYLLPSTSDGPKTDGNLSCEEPTCRAASPE